MPRILRAALMLAAITAGTLLPACSNKENRQASPTSKVTTTRPPVTATVTSTTPESTTSAAPQTIEKEVEQAYQDINLAELEQLRHPDPVPDVFAGHSGPHNDLVVSVNRDYAARGLIATPGPSGRWPVPEILSTDVAGDQATLRVCIIDDVRIVEAATQIVVNDVVASRLSTATMVLQGDGWVLYSHRLDARWEDDKGCNR